MCAQLSGKLQRSAKGLINSRYMLELEAYNDMSAADDKGVAAWEPTALAPIRGETRCSFRVLITMEPSRQTIFLVRE
jgi:hypothetical protein